jgi:hypothetical protein
MLDMEDAFTKISKHADWVIEHVDPQVGHLEYGNALLIRQGLENLEQGKLVSSHLELAVEECAKKLELGVFNDGFLEKEKEVYAE